MLFIYMYVFPCTCYCYSIAFDMHMYNTDSIIRIRYICSLYISQKKKYYKVFINCCVNFHKFIFLVSNHFVSLSQSMVPKRFFLQFRNEQCDLPGFSANTFDLKVSSWTIVFMSFSADTIECLLLWGWISLTMSKFSLTSSTVRRQFADLVTLLSLMFAPSPKMDVFRALFKCSMWRSHEIFFPRPPFEFTNRDHLISKAIWGGSP